MLVYGDRTKIVDPATHLIGLAGQLREIAATSPGIDRHAKLVGALVEGGQLLQGVADEGSAATELCSFLQKLAHCAVRSFDSDFNEIGELPTVPSGEMPRSVQLRLPEGFAYYSVYPEAYVEAARKLRLRGPPLVIGIRSIGTTLGATVAAAIGAQDFITVRPLGDPFAREVELPSETINDHAHYVIVDEGPGLSGSSFGAVADWLQERGVPLERIAFLPSHAGDLGPQASEAHRRRWSSAQRVAARFRPFFLEQKFPTLEVFAGGGSSQRTKFRAMRDDTRLLLKFAGIGSIGQRKLEMARSLHAAGFTPEPVGLVHGFLVERWCENAQPLGSADKPLDEVGRYLGARNRLFPSGEGSGATIAELLEMCHRNVGLALGSRAARRVACFDARALSASVRRVRTDNKMAPEEWLRTPSGKLVKTDALDHHQGHDLIGCQGIEWDLAGFSEEFGLDPRERSLLADAASVNIDPDLLQFYRHAYAAFRLGQSELAGDRGAAERYGRSIELLLHQNS